MTAEPAVAADKLVALGGLTFADFALVEDATLRAALGGVEPALLAPALIRHPAVLRRLLTVLPSFFPFSPRSSSPFPLSSPSSSCPCGCLRSSFLSPQSSLSSPCLRGSNSSSFDLDLVRAHAWELLAETRPALFECLPWFAWNPAAAIGRPPWRTRLLVVGDAPGAVVAACRRFAGVTVAEMRTDVADYVRRKATRVGVKRLDVLRLPLADALASPGFDFALVTLPADDGPAGVFDGLAACRRPALVAALRPGAESEVTPPAGWRGVALATVAGPRPGWRSPFA